MSNKPIFGRPFFLKHCYMDGHSSEPENKNSIRTLATDIYVDSQKTGQFHGNLVSASNTDAKWKFFIYNGINLRNTSTAFAIVYFQPFSLTHSNGKMLKYLINLLLFTKVSQSIQDIHTQYLRAYGYIPDDNIILYYIRVGICSITPCI